MQYQQNQTCCQPNYSVTGWCYSGCGQLMPIVPGSNPALQIWNGQNFIVADGSSNNPIFLPALQTNAGTPNHVVGANNAGQLFFYPYAIPTTVQNLAGGAAGNIPWQSAPSVTNFVPAGDVNEVLISGGAGSPSWTPQSLIISGGFSGSLTGDVTGTQSSTSVVKVNGSFIPVSTTVVGTNSSGQFVDATSVVWSIPEQINSTSSTSYTLQLNDAGKIVSFSSTSTVSVIVPNSSTVSFQTGMRVDLLAFGTGQVTVSGASGVTVNSSFGLNLRTQFSPASLLYMGANIWVLMGDTTT